ncbi:hypothetical protein J3Q64DRAFT_1745028 [Phycomyces blakesleeanus]|uniref:Uncharacterized protein n=2 Tax=Phycomyces blakesleeanus TaxID=4837 RepID=A0A163DY06_PHYB8|nr:hypothetical protein PHYBLDRAFT_167545 [Phycomyces blakesleeanus NRRL 1555(-)]OAD74120.1 hypothetical protein PHYBLDRAFT_167545 [Phycomyces blakesleeanus NRRL 1555(-)]|eukprot:XP_018292160.1 hypothetical protein PHYBLDRAFT_167545 [Phycomyces blakesleeanus NRRL 1555(-)]
MGIDNEPISWQKEFSEFLKGMGLIETSNCFETELLILSQHNLERLPTELEKLVERLLQSLERHIDAKEAALTDASSLDESSKVLQGSLYTKRKRSLDCTDEEWEAKERIKRLDGEQVQIRATNAEVDNRIQTFIQAKQNDIDASNRTEFLNRPDPTVADVTCARADAREINRNIQMKFDIVNNEDGPLARSMLSANELVRQTGSSSHKDQGIIDRLQDIEEHLNVRFEADARPPFSLAERIKILENTLMELERQHPTWSAIHFNQPNRVFPPPPPVTYIARPGVPTDQDTGSIHPHTPNFPLHQVSATQTSTGAAQTAAAPMSTSSTVAVSVGDTGTGSAQNSIQPIQEAAYVTTLLPTIAPPSTSSRMQIKTTGRANSSLTRAVIEQLNRQHQASNAQAVSETVGTQL